MRAGDWIQILVMVLVLGFVFLGLVRSTVVDARSAGGRMTKRVATGLVVRRLLRASDHRWN